MKQHFVPHPGSLLREDILPALGLTVTEAAGQLGVSRSALTRLINEHAAISAEMALRLEQWITNPPASMWLQLQNDRDLWEVEQRGVPKIVRAAPRTEAPV
ncbi:HigA family addiction module antitoxin [Caballeronia sp. KNU42]